MKTIPLISLKHKKGPWQFLFFCWDIGIQKVIDDKKKVAKRVKRQRQKVNKQKRALIKFLGRNE